MTSSTAAGAPVRFTTWLTPGIDIAVFELAAELMSEALHRQVDLSLVTDRSGPADAAAFTRGDVDLGWMCSTAYVQLADVELVGVSWVPIDEDVDGEPVYFSDLVVRPGGRVGSLDDITGCRVGCNDPMSLSGHYGLKFALADSSTRLDAVAEVVFTGGHLASFEALDRGEIDAAVVDSITRHVHRPDLVPVERIGPWPTQPLVAASSFEPEQRDVVRDALLHAADTARWRSVLEAAGLSGFAAVDEERYRSVGSRLRSLESD